MESLKVVFKTLQSFACLTLPENRDKGIISKILMRNLPHIVICFPKISKLRYFWHQLSPGIHKSGMISSRMSLYLRESVKFSDELHFLAWTRPFLQ